MATPNKKLLWGFYNVQNQRKVERQALKPRKKKKREKRIEIYKQAKNYVSVYQSFLFLKKKRWNPDEKRIRRNKKGKR